MAMAKFPQTFEEEVEAEDFDPRVELEKRRIECAAYFLANPVMTYPDVVYCNSTFDTFSCWPATVAGNIATVQCPDSFISNELANTSKLCQDNGTWGPANYETCIMHRHITPDNLRRSGVIMIYDIGYSITTVALLISLTIFIYFKSLRCLRNSIHCNLIAAMLFANLKWLSLRLNHINNFPKGMCQAVITLATYFQVTIFFWMFVEGLYLFTIILWAFSAQKIRLWYYLIIGWGVPFVITCIWVGVRSQYESLLCWLPEDKYDNIDYIYKAPILAVLLINVFFITVIIWVLVTKLKASNTLETRQYRKALKAIVVLVPLLGVTYILFIQTPYNNPRVKFVMEHVNAVLNSLQGLFVAIFYCFLNGEVRSVIRQKLNAIQESRTFSRYSKSSFFNSPRRSSCYALAVTNCNGKAGSDRKSTGSGSVQIKLSRTEPETEASASMMDNML